MADVGETRALTSNSTKANIAEEPAPRVEQRTVPENGAGHEAAGEQQHLKEEDDNFSMLVVAGAVPKQVPDQDDPLPFE